MKVRTIILASFLVVITIIPVAAFLLSQNYRSSSSANTTQTVVKKTVSKTQEATKSGSIVDQPGAETPVGGVDTPPAASASGGLAVSGPTLGFKIQAEGRTNGDQSNKVFVGISQASATGAAPSYLLSFTVDVPASGEYTKVPLAGLTPGTNYTAYLKGQAQIATSSAFLMLPSTSVLNNGFLLKLITGDVNDDNVINQSDYDIVRAYFGTTRASNNWNPILDFNLDGVINGFELGIISSRIGKTGATTTGTTGPWISSPTSSSSGLSSGSNIGGVIYHQPTDNGYWQWIPEF